MIRTFVDAKSADLQSAAIDRSATPPNLRQTRREISLFSPSNGRALLANPMGYVKGKSPYTDRHAFPTAAFAPTQPANP